MRANRQGINGPSDRLVLFDIDGTLIRRAGAHHRQALADAIREVTSYPTTLDGVSTSGMLDPDLIRLMLANAGAPAGIRESALEEICRVAQRLYEACCPDLTAFLCPGVNEALAMLSASGIPAGLVSGNLSRIGWKKMRQCGLHHHFLLGAFAEMAGTRIELVALALEKARQMGLVSGDLRAALIGDHTNDIEAARRNNIQAIGVATGFTTVEELRAAGADVVLEDLNAFHVGLLPPQN